MAVLDDLCAALIKGRMSAVKDLTLTALEAGVPAQEILNGGLLAGMGVIGERFKNSEIYVPEVLMAAKAMAAGTEILKPFLQEGGVSPIGRAIIGTVKGDRHDIGKNLVKMMLEGKGIEVVDLGVDVPAERFLAKQRETGARLVCCSALLTTTMVEMGNVVELFKRENVRGEVKIMIGGAPVTQAFCDQIGADAYTPDAGSAAEKAAELLASFR